MANKFVSCSLIRSQNHEVSYNFSKNNVSGEVKLPPALVLPFSVPVSLTPLLLAFLFSFVWNECRVSPETATRECSWPRMLLSSSCLLLGLKSWRVGGLSYIYIQYLISMPLRERDCSANRIGITALGYFVFTLQLGRPVALSELSQAHEVMPSWPLENVIPWSTAVKIEHSNNILFATEQQS